MATETPTRYEYRIPEDLPRLQAVKLEDRARFDWYQRKLFVAYTVKAGDWLTYRRGIGGKCEGGIIDAVLDGRDGKPVFAVNGFAVEVFDIEDTSPGTWFLMVGDRAEAETAKGEWTAVTVKAVEGPRQYPLYRVEESRRRFGPSQMRIPA